MTSCETVTQTTTFTNYLADGTAISFVLHFAVKKLVIYLWGLVCISQYMKHTYIIGYPERIGKRAYIYVQIYHVFFVTFIHFVIDRS